MDLRQMFDQEAFYFSVLSGADADVVLLGKPRGSFLVRFSPNSNAPVISFVSGDDGSVTHALVQQAEGGGMALQGGTKSFIRCVQNASAGCRRPTVVAALAICSHITPRL
jgi:hypothetical protein